MSTNWSGGVRFNASALRRVVDEAHLAKVIDQARRSQCKVRVMASGHSFVPFWADGDWLVDASAFGTVGLVDRASGEVDIGAGAPLHALGEPLWRQGYALANLGDIDRQTLAGAISTGTHGTGIGLGNLASHVVSIRLVNDQGQLCTLTGERARAAVSLGALGVVVRYRVRVVPRYGLHERQWQESVPHCLAALGERIEAFRHFEFFYGPQQDVCYCKSLAEIEAPTNIGPVPEIPFGQLSGERKGASFRILPSQRERKFNEMEFSVPFAAGEACFLAIRALLRTRFPEVAWPVEFRTVAPDEGWLSPHHGGARVAISIHEGAHRDYQPFFDEAERVFLAHDGRPHWGKLHSRQAAALAPCYPGWNNFQALRDELDPSRTFSNHYLTKLIG